MPVGFVKQLYFGFYFIDILTTGATRTRSDDFNIGRIDVDFNRIINQRIKTYTETKEVCRLALLSKGEMRTNLCTPFSPLRYPKAKSPSISRVTVLIPAAFTFLKVEFFDFIARFFGPHHIHTHEHFRPIAFSGSASTSRNLNDSTERITFRRKACF